MKSIDNRGSGALGKTQKITYFGGLMSRKRQSILLSGAILAAGVWLFAFVMLFSQPGSSVDPSTIPTLASLPKTDAGTEQENSETVGQAVLEDASSESTALPTVVLNPPNQTNVN